MKQWACSRKFGLGTKLPFDKDWLIESLSDSTIYMAYYTISHFFDGKVSNTKSDMKIKIEPNDLTNEVFDYIFLDTKKAPQNLKNLSLDIIKKMKKEFKYWYPLDLRVSGKDLINNHLVMCLYNHAFIWNKQNWPRSMFTNGHALINAEKMSKSTGNFLTLNDCIEHYGADATRLCFADAGDGLDDANFAPETCNSAINKLTKELSWIEKILNDIETKCLNSIEEREIKGNFPDEVLDNEINKAMSLSDKAYSEMKFRVVVNKGLYKIISSKNFYLTICGNSIKKNKNLLLKYIRSTALLLAPICSHWSENIWKKLGNKKSIFSSGKWPKNVSENSKLSLQFQFLKDSSHYIRKSLKDFNKFKKKKKINGLPICYLITLNNHNKFKSEIIKTILNLSKGKIDFDNFEKKDFDLFVKSTLKEIKNSIEKNKIKEAMQFSAFILKEIEERGKLALSLKLPFNQIEILKKYKTIITKEIESEIKELKFIDLDLLGEKDIGNNSLMKAKKVIEKVSPGKVGVFLSMDY